jgi:hypothetical protein
VESFGRVPIIRSTVLPSRGMLRAGACWRNLQAGGRLPDPSRTSGDDGAFLFPATNCGIPDRSLGHSRSGPKQSLAHQMRGFISLGALQDKPTCPMMRPSLVSREGAKLGGPTEPGGLYGWAVTITHIAVEDRVAVEDRG